MNKGCRGEGNTYLRESMPLSHSSLLILSISLQSSRHSSIMESAPSRGICASSQSFCKPSVPMVEVSSESAYCSKSSSARCGVYPSVFSLLFESFDARCFV
jgi:hypothetical protein